MINIKKTKGNITLVTEQMPTMLSAAVGIWVRTGAVNETPEMAGVSHLLEHMTFKGTHKRSAAAIAEDMDKIGGQMNAFTGKEVTCYYIKTLEKNLTQGMEILLDMFTDSTFEPEELEREKKVIYEEMKMVQDMPDEDVQDMIGELLLRESPYGHSIIGTQDTVGKVDSPALHAYRNGQYTADSVVVAVAGRFDEEKVESMVDTYLQGLQPTKETPLFTLTTPEPAFQVKVRDINQTHLCLATRTASREDPLYYARMVLNCIMGGTMSSRFFQNVREKKGLAYSVYSTDSAFAHDGYFNIYAGVAHDKVEEAVKAIKEELDRLTQDGVTPDEIDKAREQIKSSYIFGQETVNGRMSSIGRNFLLQGRIQEQKEVLERLDAVNGQQIQQAISLIGDLSRYSAAAVTGETLDLRKIVEKA